jgi:hypothetical protein
MQNFSNLVSYAFLLVFSTIMFCATATGCETNATTAVTAAAGGSAGLVGSAGIAGFTGGAGGGLNAR